MYEHILNIGMESPDEDPPLDAYLRSLWLVVSSASRTNLTLGQFSEWLTAAFETTPPPFDEKWLSVSSQHARVDLNLEDATFKDWESVILFQIADLKRMEESGQLENEYKGYGIDSPSGDRWYNFDLGIYLECAARGTFGFGENGEKFVEEGPFSWGDFIGFLVCGQIYE